MLEKWYSQGNHATFLATRTNVDFNNVYAWGSPTFVYASGHYAANFKAETSNFPSVPASMLWFNAYSGGIWMYITSAGA